MGINLLFFTAKIRILLDLVQLVTTRYLCSSPIISSTRRDRGFEKINRWDATLISEELKPLIGPLEWSHFALLNFLILSALPLSRPLALSFHTHTRTFHTHSFSTHAVRCALRKAFPRTLYAAHPERLFHACSGLRTPNPPSPERPFPSGRGYS
jgi:hypothetical protein